MGLMTKVRKLQKMNSDVEKCLMELSSEVNEVCEFHAGLTIVSGEGLCVINEDEADVASIGCLKGKSKSNKLTLEEFNSQTF